MTTSQVIFRRCSQRRGMASVPGRCGKRTCWSFGIGRPILRCGRNFAPAEREARAELARRYFTGYGPTDWPGFRRWSGFYSDAANPVIDLMEAQKEVTQRGGTMRLGAYDCMLRKGSRVQMAYQKNKIKERHRHRLQGQCHAHLLHHVRL